MKFFHDLDLALLLSLHEHLSNKVFDAIMPIITHVGVVVWIAGSILLLFSKKYRGVGILSLCALTLGGLVINLTLKNIFERPRPFAFFDHIALLISKPHEYSFPSGHALSSFAAATVIGNKIKALAPLVFMLATLISFSRIYLLVHFPFDVICGAFLGFFCARLVIYACDKIKIFFPWTSTIF